MRAGKHRHAFSLLEVIIAVAVFATGVVVLLALLPSTLRSSADSLDTLTALRLPDAIRGELLRRGGADPVANIGGQLAELGQPTDGKLRLVTARTDEDIRTPGLDTRDQFFLIEIFRFSSGQLAYHHSAPTLAMQVRVSWPYLPPGAVTPAAAENRSHVTFNLALNR